MPGDDNFLIFMIFIIEICGKKSPLSVTQTKNSGSPMGVLSQGRAYYEELATTIMSLTSIHHTRAAERGRHRDIFGKKCIPYMWLF